MYKHTYTSVYIYMLYAADCAGEGAGGEAPAPILHSPTLKHVFEDLFTP